MTVRDDLGVDVPRVTEWIVEHVPDVAAPLSLEFISGGRSNLTYRMVDAAGRELVLRRPPLGNVLHTAHDMGREHRIIAALAPTDVPVAEALGHCDDVTVTGAPFYVMAFVPGVVLATIADAEAYPATSRRPGRRRPRSTSCAGCTPSTPTPSASARWPARRATSSAS